ncbi:MAG: 50S ribosomal protein L15 [Patescibacteria group bacterium]|mgnify:CR=1 FL=1
MRLHDLKPTYKRKAKKHIGRGGKRGTYSGRGEKGQRKRSGHRIRPAERDLIMRLPKLRGIKHKSLEGSTSVINVGNLEAIFNEPKITRKILLDKGITRKLWDPVKILGNGEVKRAFVIEGIPVSKSAKEKIEKAGGSVK